MRNHRMKRATTVLSAVVVFAFLTVWDSQWPHVDSAAKPLDTSTREAFLAAQSRKQNKRSDDPHRDKNGVIPSERGPESSQDKQRNRVADPDLPPGVSGVDKETYLRLRSEYIWRLRGWEPGKPFDSGARGRALRQMEEQEARIADAGKSWFDKLFGISGTPSVAAPWMALGPAPIPNGQTTTRSDPVSGRVTAIAVHPANPNVAYLGTAQGG